MTNVKNQAQYEAGYNARMAGKARYYGCHTGMKSTLESDKADFFTGWDTAATDIVKFGLSIPVKL